MTTTIVMHDAHVCARVSFVAACAVTAHVVATAKARCARKAARAAMRVAKRAAVKAANAVKVARKEAAEKHASVVRAHTVRVHARAAAKAAAAPMVRAAKKQAAAVAKLLKAANATRLAAVRAQRMAAKATATIEAATTRATATTTVGTRATAAATRSAADVRASKAAIVAFLAMTPCIHALWFMATFDMADKAAKKEVAKAANKARASIRAPRVRVNDDAKRASITLACANARASKAARAAADAHAMASMGSVMSQRTIEARAAQGDAQRAANAARKAAAPAKTPKVRPFEGYVVGMSDTPILGKLVGAHSSDARYKSTHVVHATSGTKVADARGEFKTLASAKKAAKAALAIEQAAKWAARKEAYRMRKEAMAVIAADAWMNKGVWLSEDLIRGANDWSYTVRINAFKEARNIAYGTVALVGGAA